MAKPNEKQLAIKNAQAEKERGYLRMFTRIYVVFVLAFYPLYINPERYTNIVYRKAHVYWIFSLLFIIGFMLFYIPHVLSKPKMPERKPIWKYLSVPDWAALAFLLIITLSSILSEYQDVVWLGFRNRHDGWLTMFCMLACYFIISRWYRPSHFDFSIFAVSASVISAIAVLQFYSIDIFKLYPINESTPEYFGVNIFYRTTIGNVDFVGCYACMAILVFTVLYVKTEKKLRILYFFASVASFLLLLVSQVYQGKVGVAGACFLLLPYWMSERKTFGRFLIQLAGWGFAYWLQHWYLFERFLPSLGDAAQTVTLRSVFPTWPLKEILMLSAVAFAVGLALCFAKKLKWPKLRTVHLASVALFMVIIFGGLAVVEYAGKDLPENNIFYQAREILHGNFRDEFGSARGLVWKRAVAQIPEHAFIGTGADTFYYAYGEENQIASRQAVGVAYDKAHNDFIQIALCYGLGGLFAYLTLIGGMMLLSAKKAFFDEFLLVASGGALAYITCSLFGIDTVIVTPIYWLLLAFIRSRQMSDESIPTL